MTAGMSGEVERLLDTLEGWIGDQDFAVGEIVESFPDERERSDIAKRLYDLGPELAAFALRIWPAAGQA